MYYTIYYDTKSSMSIGQLSLLTRNKAFRLLFRMMVPFPVPCPGDSALANGGTLSLKGRNARRIPPCKITNMYIRFLRPQRQDKDPHGLFTYGIGPQWTQPAAVFINPVCCQPA